MDQIQFKLHIWEKFSELSNPNRFMDVYEAKFFGKLQNLSLFEPNPSFFAEGLYSLFQQICSE